MPEIDPLHPWADIHTPRSPVKVWRYWDTPSGESLYLTREPGVPQKEPGLWFATTPEAVAELRERLATAIGDDDRMYVPSSHLEVLADAVLRALGFQGAE